MKIAPPIGLLICSSISCWLLFNVSLVAETAPVAPRGAGPEPAFPAYLGSFTDSLSGARATRITGDQGQPIPNTNTKWAGRTRSVYNLKQVWSADEKLLFLGIGGPLLLDGETYQVLHPWGPPAPGTWHPARPDVMINVKDNAVCEWNARSNVTRQLVRLAGYADFVQSSSEDWISADGRLIGVTARREADGKDVGFLVDLDAGWPEHPNYYGEVSWSLREDKLRTLGPAGSHTPGRALRLPGWVFASTFGKGGTVFMVKLDGSGETRTVCQTWHREPVNHRAQTQAVPSPSGARVLFASNWGTGPDYNDEETHSFVADLRIKR